MSLNSSTVTGVKNHLSGSPGQVKFQSGQAYIFIQCPTGKYKKYSVRLYFLECLLLFGNRTNDNLGVLVRRTSEDFKICLPLCYTQFCIAKDDLI